ncbi:hypothetical protein [Actomonas aquatica]|uniref:Uncharacterized protein n=1 Tax=Actomonas aquatica TaxID=2866162 RepID=A0ABZ1CC83_9BACT|nr:hypothetical protein [Opitutus sp. WL0086]WRQ87900.1 hypothetical protein K1X11_000670 [Opitutus sp. WL0086]
MPLLRRSRKRSLLLAVGLLTAAIAAAKTPETLVVTDRFDTAPDFVPPTADAPCPYFLLTGSELALGTSVAGQKQPPAKAIAALVADALRSQHYVPTTVGGPAPELVIVFHWGNANLELDEWEETDPNTGESETQSIARNTPSIARLIGLDRLQERSLSLAEEHRLATILSEDRLYLVIGALDATALANGQRRLVWRTWISIPALRHNLTRDLPAMLAHAAPHLGRESDAPLIFTRGEAATEVEVGTPTVVPDAEPNR